jgi:spermidine synthase
MSRAPIHAPSHANTYRRHPLNGGTHNQFLVHLDNPKRSQRQNSHDTSTPSSRIVHIMGRHDQSRLCLPSLVILFLLLADAACQIENSSSSSRQSPHNIGEYFPETGFYQGLRIKDRQPLLRKQSPYQLIEVHYNPHFGKILVLDGVIQLTERDGDAYNEMMAHLPLMQHPNPKRVLVIGGGDGYVVQEVLKHDSVIQVDHVDLDQDVIQVCKQMFPWGAVWDDPRVKLHIRDGAAFLEEVADQTYDVIIQDSSDPWTYDEFGDQVELPSSVLYSVEHFVNLYRKLKPNGVLNIQAETLQLPSDLEAIAKWRDLAIHVGFIEARYASIMISTVRRSSGFTSESFGIHLYGSFTYALLLLKSIYSIRRDRLAASSLRRRRPHPTTKNWYGNDSPVFAMLARQQPTTTQGFKIVPLTYLFGPKRKYMVGAYWIQCVRIKTLPSETRLGFFPLLPPAGISKRGAGVYLPRTLFT